MEGAAPRRERGAVTAETAAVLPVLVLLAVFAMSSLAALGAQLRCQDAAREAARAAARSEPTSVVRELAETAGPAGSVVAVMVGSDRVVVTVQARVRVLGPSGPGIAVRGSAVAYREPGAP
ncbi:MAG: pilus assembly protein [Actinobacteria bacterium]|nr:pilus assembly protein [Actinomycetota bacterium]MBI3686366.1 pilus assembly protein [Actinomycetota bacterium]